MLAGLHDRDGRVLIWPVLVMYDLYTMNTSLIFTSGPMRGVYNIYLGRSNIKMTCGMNSTNGNVDAVTTLLLIDSLPGNCKQAALYTVSCIIGGE